MYYIYKLYNNNELLYVGKTVDFFRRLKEHESNQPWSKEITHVEVGKCKNRIDMDLCEVYYINKLEPKYNKASVYEEKPTFCIENLKFERYKLNEFWENSKSKIKNNKRKCLSEKERNTLLVNKKIENSKEIKEGCKIDFLKSKKTMYYWFEDNNTKVCFLNLKCDSDFFRDIFRRIKSKECIITDKKYILTFECGEKILNHIKIFPLVLDIDIYNFNKNKNREINSKSISLLHDIKIDNKTGYVDVSINKVTMENEFLKYFY